MPSRPAVLPGPARGLNEFRRVEWLPIFLPSLWLAALYWSDRVAAIAGLVWVVGRIVYFIGYRIDASKRSPGFFIQVSAVAVLLLGALGHMIYLAATA